MTRECSDVNAKMSESPVSSLVTFTIIYVTHELARIIILSIGTVHRVPTSIHFKLHS